MPTFHAFQWGKKPRLLLDPPPAYQKGGGTSLLDYSLFACCRKLVVGVISIHKYIPQITN